MTHAQLIAVSVLGMLTVPSTGVAATRNVPAQYRSIQAAISAATNGDEVVVATGTYRENINFRGKSITVRSTDPSDPAVVATTIIDGSSREAPVVMFDSGEGKRSILDGFTITGGTGWYHDGGGVYCRKSSPVVRRNVITRNSVVADGLGGGDGGGVYCAFGSSAIIEGNTISGNTASVYGGGISAYESSPTIRGNTITNNRAGDRPLSGWGGGISALWDAKIERNLVSGNHAGGGGGGISGGSLVVGNTITGNTCGGDGGGIRCGPATIEGNMIADNRAIDGGGIWCSGPSTIKGNTIADNRATDGGGVYCFYLRPPDPVPLARGATHAASYPIEGPVIQGNVISRNTAIYWGGGVLCHASPAVLLNDTIVGNHARMGGGVYCIADTYWDDPVIAAIRNCIIAYTTRGGGIVAEGGNAYRLLGERVSYCDLYANTGGNYHPFVLTGRGNLSLDPMFADAANGDFHLKSLGGRRTPDGWVVDTVHSPCIDAGDPAADYSLEPHPNGNRANLGFEGGTAQASRSHWLPTQPDMLIRNAGEAQFIGNDVYNPGGFGQTRRQTVTAGATAVYVLRVQNDAASIDSFVIRGGGSSAQFQVRYFGAVSGGRDITKAVTVLGWHTKAVAPTQGISVWVEVTPLARAPVGASWALLISGTSVGNHNRVDVVRAITTVAAAGAGVGISGLSASPTPAGAQITFLLASPAEVAACVLNLAGRRVRTICAGRGCPAGTNTLLWDLRGETGVAVPNGNYLVELTVRDADGRQARAVARLSLTR